MAKNIKILLLIFLVVIVIAIIFLLKRSVAFEPRVISNLNTHMLNISSVFLNGETIPDKYGCHGADVNPPLKFSSVPEGTKSLVLIVDDPDAPSGDWVHWLVFNIDPQSTGINENSTPGGAVVGLNSFGEKNYGGPCPPSGAHRYNFKLYALDIVLGLDSSAEKEDVLRAMDGHVLDGGVLMGMYGR